MKYLKPFNESETMLNNLVNKTRSISDEDDKEIEEIFTTLTDIGFSIGKYSHPEYYVGTQYCLDIRIKPEKYLLGRRDQAIFYVGGHEHYHKPLQIDEIIKSVEELDQNPKFEMVSDEIMSSIYETLDRIGESKFKLIYFELKLSNNSYLTNRYSGESMKPKEGEADVTLFFQITN